MTAPYERLQVLVRPDQAAHLRTTARLRGVPVTQLVREALDAALPTRSPDEDAAAWAAFESLPVVSAAPTPDELEASLDDRGHSWWPPGA